MAIYDLSQGMARNLSAQFLGPNHVIDMIPHTGILVFGKEYFFGGGIQAVDPHAFRATSGLHPVQTQRLGITNISQAEFEEWCQTTGANRFNVHSYDLLQCNCNHFSHEAALQGLKLSRGVPEWVLEVPQRFLSSPMGQMIRPMLEQMQVTQRAPVRVPSSMMNMTMPTTTTTTASSSTLNVAANPWANIKSAAAASDTQPMSPTTETTTPLSSRPCILKKFTKPMISNDTKSIPICLSKLSPLFSNDSTKKEFNKLAKTLQATTTTTTTTTSNSDDNSNNNNNVEMVVAELWRLLREGVSVSFVLLFLRLVVLDYCNNASSSIQDCVEWISEQFQNGWETPAARSLAWCVVSNYHSNIIAKSSPKKINYSAVVDSAICDLGHASVPVRQAATTFLYNIIVLQQQQQVVLEQEDTMVSILCSSLESLAEEPDDTTRLRRLVIGGRIVFGVGKNNNNNNSSSSNDGSSVMINEAAKALVRDLGFVDLLQEMAKNSPLSSSGDAKECQLLAAELVEKFQY